MNGNNNITPTPCRQCPLQGCGELRLHPPAELALMQTLKQGELCFERGAAVLVQGARIGQLFTLLRGVLMRYKLLADGRRQILNFMFPGDLIGLQGALDMPLTHGVEAITPATLCVFQRERFAELIKVGPDLGVAVTWLAAKEEAALEEHLVALGQRTASERIAYLAVYLMQRGIESGVAANGVLRLTITQTQIADMLGLSLVHTNRTLQALRRSKLIGWSLAQISIPDLAAAREYAQFDSSDGGPRPFL